MKRLPFLLLFLMLLSVICSPFMVEAKEKEPVPEPVPLTWNNDYIVSSNTVSLNNSDLEISVTPHTSSGGWVYVSFNAKKFAKSSTSLVDLLFGFTEDRVSVSKFELYDPHSVRTDHNESIGLEYYSKNSNFSLGFTGNLLTFYEKDAKGVKQAKKSVTFDKYGSYDYNSTLTFGWYTYHSYHVEEYRKSEEEGFEKSRFKVVGGAEKWVSVPIAADSKAKKWDARFWLDVVPSTEVHVGEYWVGVKSSNESLTDCLKFKHFTAIDPWYDATFPYKMKLTVDQTKVDADLTNFPVFVHLTSARINWSNVQDDLDDLRFTDSTESVLLDAELESSVVNTNACIHVRVLAISGTVDTDFYLYYGNPSATSAWDGEGVWDSNFVMVQHMTDATTSTILDSTLNSNDGSKKGPNEPILTASGQINSAQDFTGDYVTIGDKSSLDFGAVTDFTLEAIVKTTTVLANTAIISKKWSWISNLAYFMEVSSGVAKIMIGGISSSSVTSINDNTWHYVVGAFDRSDKQYLYVDNILEDSDTISAIGNIDTAEPFYIGRFGYGDYYFTGIIDEVRVSNILRSSAWIKASYYSGMDGLLGYGAEEEAPIYLNIGEFVAPIIVYPNKYMFLNLTVVYDNTDRTDIKNASLEIDGGVKLFWDEATKVFSESADPSSYVTLNATGSAYSIVNSTAYKLSWKVTFAKTYPEGYVDALSSGTEVYTDDGLTASNSEADWFLFTAPPSPVNLTAFFMLLCVPLTFILFIFLRRRH